MSQYLMLVASIVVSVLGGGGLGAWLSHRRLTPKSHAEAHEITAAAIDKDYARFEREINRLVNRLEIAEDKSERAIKRAEDCEVREMRLTARIVELEAYNAGLGHARQEAASIIAAERLNHD